MHALGNNFGVLDGINGCLDLSAGQLRLVADRHFGIGCDQILQVEPSREAGTYFYRIFNADGGEVEQCGNGARCFVRYVRDKGLTNKTEIRSGTRGGVIVPRLEDDGQVTVDMDVPVFDPSRIPFEISKQALTYELEIGQQTLEISVLSMGNPHAVQIVSDVDVAPVATQGALIEKHPRFPQRVNAGYMQVVDRGLLDTRVTVTTRGGDLGISWPGEGALVMMTGPAVTVFEGEIDI